MLSGIVQNIVGTVVGLVGAGSTVANGAVFAGSAAADTAWMFGSLGANRAGLTILGSIDDIIPLD